MGVVGDQHDRQWGIGLCRATTLHRRRREGPKRPSRKSIVRSPPNKKKKKNNNKKAIPTVTMERNVLKTRHN
ncbi:uncharacterized protein YALI1_B01352g [Yarrowia lipolytica]|uniref:Uncharacterized protein n=1 Tax=Yarrowia lipolytica TaxID=4952 RepID=A0A1D8N5X2_YARLL|nr:hypothetical protein YALI1_B01352g [Yarrowia lipolytica]